MGIRRLIYAFLFCGSAFLVFHIPVTNGFSIACNAGAARRRIGSGTAAAVRGSARKIGLNGKNDVENDAEVAKEVSEEQEQEKAWVELVKSRTEKLSPLEIRLDLSILWCFILGRGLFAEILTRPLKTSLGRSPGIELEDMQILLSLVSSASLLSILWAVVGIATAQFQAWDDQEEFWRRSSRAESDDFIPALLRYLLPTVVTWLIVGPLWLAGDEAGRVEASLALSLSPTTTTAGFAADEAMAKAIFSQSLARSAVENAATDLSALLGLLLTVVGARVLSLWLP